MAFTSRASFHIFLITIFGFLAYSNTFSAPFVFDDFAYIVENPVIKEFDYFLEPSKVEDAELSRIVLHTRKPRYVGFLTFWANYRLHGLNVTGYHVVNLAIHLMNSIVLYMLVLVTFRTRFLKTSALSKQARYIALFSALLFVSHPIQTQAVTYITQRFTSLATLFYLLSLLSYVSSRLSGASIRRYALYALSLVSAVLAMLTKQNAFTLPLAIALYEVMFFEGRFRRRAVRVFPFFLAMFIIPLSLMDIDRPLGEVLEDASRAPAQPALPRWKYLVVQFRVIVTYLRLLLLPVNQNLDYDYFRYSPLFMFQAFLSFLFLSALFLSAVYLFRRFRHSASWTRIIAFGISWFFLTLSVESSIIPIYNLIFEHRVYLPSAWVFVAAVTGAVALIGRLKTGTLRITVVSAVVLLPFVFSVATYARNSVWKSRVSLWEDTARKSGQKARPLINLGIAYIEEGEPEKAIPVLTRVLDITPKSAKVWYHLGSAFRGAGQPRKAIQHYMTAIRLNPDHKDAHYYLALTYYSVNLLDEAIKHYRIALDLKPDDPVVHTDMGNAYAAMGLIDRAMKHYLEALRLKPDDPVVHNNLANAYGIKNQTEKAVEHYKIALRLGPDNADAHYNLGLVYLKQGFKEKARREFEAVLKINPDDRQAVEYLDYISTLK